MLEDLRLQCAGESHLFFFFLPLVLVLKHVFFSQKRRVNVSTIRASSEKKRKITFREPKTTRRRRLEIQEPIGESRKQIGTDRVRWRGRWGISLFLLKNPNVLSHISL